MELVVSNKHTHERKIADLIVKKVKSNAIIPASSGTTTVNQAWAGWLADEFESRLCVVIPRKAGPLSAWLEKVPSCKRITASVSLSVFALSGLMELRTSAVLSLAASHISPIFSVADETTFPVL